MLNNQGLNTRLEHQMSENWSAKLKLGLYANPKSFGVYVNKSNILIMHLISVTQFQMEADYRMETYVAQCDPLGRLLTPRWKNMDQRPLERRRFYEIK